MLKKIKDKKIVYIISSLLLVLLCFVLIILTIDSAKITEIKDFVKTNVKLLYITESNDFDYPIEVLDKYSIDYININSSELTIFERKKIKNIIEYNDLSNVLVVFKNGKIEDVLIKCNNQEEVNKFLQKNSIIPEIIANNVKQISEDSLKILNSEYCMIYIPYKNIDEIEKQENIFIDIAKEYSIEYKRIDAYLLSLNQQEKINSLLGISDVEDQILVLIKNGKMIANIRGIHSKNTYIENLYDVNFIDELEDKIHQIDFDEFKDLLQDNNKNIILVASSDGKDSNEVYTLLNEMIYNYEIEVNYINIQVMDSELYNSVKEELENIGYDGSFSLPLVIISESNKVLSYAIGNSKEEYFIDVFIENGVIKGDVINE